MLNTHLSFTFNNIFFFSNFHQRRELRRENAELHKSKNAEIKKSKNRKMESLKIENMQCLKRGI